MSATLPTRRAGLAVVASVVLAVAFMALPARGVAATVALTSTGSGGSMIVYRGGESPAETNIVTMSRAGDSYNFQDTAGVTDVGGCDDVDNEHATCPATGVEAIQLFLNNGNDELTIADSASPVRPVTGSPRITADGGVGDDLLIGAAGPESVTGGPGTDRLYGLGGDDHLDFPGPDASQDPVAGADRLDGGDGDDQLNGGPARVAQEPDILIGGGGSDLADYSQRTSPLAIALDNVGNDGEAGEGDDVQADVENVIGGSDGDTLTGSGGPNALDGRDGDDMIAGGGADDRIDGGNGNDTMSGEDGGDALTGAAGDDALSGANGDDRLSAGGGSDALAGNDGADTLAGGAGIDALDGGPGDDWLNGGDVGLVGGDGADDLDGGLGADMLLGGPGSDRLDGGLGADQINGETGRDTLTYEDRTHPVTVSLNGRDDDGEAGERDNVGDDVEVVLGGTVDDDMSGDGDANTLDGGPGEDLVTGRAGRDILEGGNAPDLIRARDGDRDRVDCGDDGDLAIVDRRDTVRDCRWTDTGGRRRLVVGRSALVVGSDFKYRLPDATRYFQLEDSLKFPVGSTIDARDGAVRLATARNSDGARQEVSILGGPFSVRQEASKRPTTDLRLVGRPRGCSRSASGPRAPADARVPKLDMRTDAGKRGRYRVKGRHSTGAPRGTSWVTEERCDGTFTRVRSGTVKVRDLERDRTVVLHAGDTYLARPR
jgi:Ca2+-binding RTX toxin-like protein